MLLEQENNWIQLRSFNGRIYFDPSVPLIEAWTTPMIPKLGKYSITSAKELLINTISTTLIHSNGKKLERIKLITCQQG